MPYVSTVTPATTPALFHRLLDDAAVFPPGLAPVDVAVTEFRRRASGPYADLVGPLLIGAGAVGPLIDVVTGDTGLAAAKDGGAGPAPVDLALVARPGTPLTVLADAVSRVEARGLMQIMPDTGVWMAQRLKINSYRPDMLFDPETNIRFGTAYLAYLSDIFSGSPVMVAAAFHAGANNVKHWALNRAQDRKTIELEQIPTSDTRSYVRKVMDAYAIYYEKDKSTAPDRDGSLSLADRRLGSGQ